MIGLKIIHLQEVDSTNNYTANLLNRGGIEGGTVIMADNQTEGRGQRGAEWHSVKGENLTFSFFIDDLHLEIHSQFNLSKVIAIILVDFFKSYGVAAKIKWPNDIYINDSKVAGVLIENQLKGGMLKSAIVGIGININQTLFEGLRATSLSLETKGKLDLKNCLFDFIYAYNQRFDSLMKVSSIALDKSYTDFLLGYEVERKYESLGYEFTGVIKGISPTGKLIVSSGIGEKEYDLKEIKMIS